MRDSITPSKVDTTTNNSNTTDENVAREAVYVTSQGVPFETRPVRGYDFNQGIKLEGLLDSYLTTGFQAMALGKAIEEINKMVTITERASVSIILTNGT
jgi:deoxyhypusine synthase